ncbi:MAG TPA: hypothetical protein ENI97_12635 [Gammaproteobacteria bacterium]|nr:hypothetical protein [Gammaproteobacteria bacterium]
MLAMFSTLTQGQYLRTAGVFILLLTLAGCAATPPSEDKKPAADSASEATKTATSAQQDQVVGTEADDAKTTDTTEVAFVPPESETKPAKQAAETKPVRIDVSCKNEPFSKYEKQSRASIAKGLAATTAGTYGVGFRNLEEHKKWSDTHGKLFTAVNQACSALSQCSKQHPKDKTKQCAQQASVFAQWQALAKNFAEKAKQAETTQPPIICSMPLSLDDPARCFHAMGESIDKTCNSTACKETSDCWRGIGFLDYAINQAASACRFAHQKLSECRGYSTAVQRRKDKFNQCQSLQKELKAAIIPVL